MYVLGSAILRIDDKNINDVAVLRFVDVGEIMFFEHSGISVCLGTVEKKMAGSVCRVHARGRTVDGRGSTRCHCTKTSWKYCLLDAMCQGQVARGGGG